MTKVLILEDLPEQTATLTYAITMVFDGASVLTASNVADAKRMILESIEQDQPFDVVIADVKVPVSAGKQPDVYPEWAHALDFLECSRTLIIPISAYLAEDKVRDLTGSSDQASTSVPKGPLYTEKLIQRIAKWIIGREMDQLFGPRGQQRPLGLSLPRSATPVSIPDLSEHIRQLWRRLGPAERDRVREHFDVKEREGEPDELASISLASKI